MNNNRLKTYNLIITLTLGIYLFLLPWDGYFDLELNFPVVPSYIMLSVLLFFSFIYIIKKRYIKIFIPKYIFFMFVLLLYVSLSLFWTLPNIGGPTQTAKLWMYFLALLVIITIIKNICVNINIILWLYVLGVFSVGMFSFLTSQVPMNRFTIALDYNPTWYAAFIVWAIVLAIKLILNSTTYSRIFLIIITVFLLFFLLLTQGRNALLSLSLSFLIVSIVHIRTFRTILKKRIKSIVKYISSVGLVIVIVVLLVNHLELEGQLERVSRIQELFGGDTYLATSGRNLIWKDYLKNIDEKNVFGVGIESSSFIYDNITSNQTTHNSYLQIFIELGLIGLTLWILFLWHLYKYSNQNITTQFYLLWITLITIFMAIGNDIFTYKYWWTGLFIFSIISIEQEGKNSKISNKIKRS